MRRRSLLKFGLLAPFAASDVVAATATDSQFLLFGKRALFGTHLCQYRPGRNFQIVLRLRDPHAAGSNPARRTRSRAPLQLAVGRLDLRRLRPGHPERLRMLHGLLRAQGSRAVDERVELEVVQTLVYAEVLAGDSRPAAHEYFVFGHHKEWYATHVMGGAPDFQQLLSLAEAPAEPRLQLPATGRDQLPKLAPGMRELHFARVESAST